MGAAMIRARLEAAVLDAIDVACATPMVWGKDDCALWCASTLAQVLGYDAAADFRGRYRTRRGAKRVTGKGGLARALARAARRHRWSKIEPAQAQSGDVGLIETIYEGERSLACVICRANGWFVGRKDFGVTAVPANRVRRAYKVAPHVRPQPLESAYRFHMPKYRRGFLDEGQPAVLYDPLSISLAIAATFDTFVSVGTVAAVESAVVGVGLSIGLNYAASALLQRGNQPISGGIGAQPNDASIRYNERQAIPPKRIIYGTAQVGGALFFEATQNPFLYQGLLICDKPISRFRKIWIGTNELDFDSLTAGAILTPVQVDGQPNYPGRLTTSLRLGATNQPVDPILLSDFPGLQGTPVSNAQGTAIGDMTAGGGLAAAFDGTESQVASSCAQLAGTGNVAAHAGKDWGVGNTKSISGYRVVAPSNSQFSASANRFVVIKLQGSTDNFSTSIVDLFTEAASSYSNGATLARGIAPGTAYRYHRIEIAETNGDAGSHNVYCAEVEFFEATGDEFRQRGIATAVLKYNFGATQDEYTQLWGQTQRPNPIFLIDGIAVPDPRIPSHILDFDPNDAAAVAAAEASWTWSNNAALCQAHYLMQRYGGRIDPRRIDWDKVKTAADWDDGLVATNEGDFIKRGTIDGLITLNQNPSDVMSSMLSANRGFVLESAGKMWVSSSAPRTSVVTIHDAILTGGIEYQAAKPKKDLINELKVRFVAPDREYQTVDGPVLTRDDLVTSDQELLASVLELPFTLDNRRAQLLQKAFLETARLGRRITCTVDVEILANASDELAGNAVTWSSDLFPKFNGTYFVESWGFTDQFSSIQLSLVEYDTSIETDFDHAVDQQPFTIADITT